MCWIFLLAHPSSSFSVPQALDHDGAEKQTPSPFGFGPVQPVESTDRIEEGDRSEVEVSLKSESQNLSPKVPENNLHLGHPHIKMMGLVWFGGGRWGMG